MRILLAALLIAGPAMTKPLTATMALATPTGPGADVGTITITQKGGEARFAVDLHGLPPGQHGFHVHANGSCAPAEKDGKVVPAGAAGPHFDPTHAGAHMGPMGAGHQGDLPFITVGPDGSVQATLIAPHIHDLSALRDKALMIHAGGDNYADQPAPLGGGGARLACGVVK
jgi:superoxide dismutase, Cu-Zn family